MKSRCPFWLPFLPLVTGTAHAQIVPAPQTRPSVVVQQAPARQEQQPSTGHPDLESLMPVWSQPLRPAPFQGFPIFPPQLPGYGAGPRTVEMPKAGLAELFQGLAISGMNQLPGSPMPAETGWPAWARTQSREPLPYEPEAALLVRNVDRVWWQPPEEDVAVPLYFHDKLRTIRKGTKIEVRTVGGFEILWYGGGRLDAQGKTEMQLEAMDEHVVAFALPQFTRVRLEGFGREFTVHLPDGSHLVLPAEAAAAPEAAVRPAEVPPFAALLGVAPGLGGQGQDEPTTPWNRARVEIVRVDEPGWRVGRAMVWNSGDIAVRWHHADGETVIAPGERVGLFLSPKASSIAKDLRAPAGVRADGDAVVCAAERATTVEWCGARFRLPAGGEVRLSPLQGQPFAAVRR